MDSKENNNGFGVYEVHDDNDQLIAVHVCECIKHGEKAGTLRAPHILSEHCPCQPLLEPDTENTGIPLYIHKITQ